MKKTILLTVVTCFLLTAAKAQLTNTKWQGTANLEQEDKSLVSAKIIWDFKKDTVTVTFPDGGTPEVMAYTVKKDILVLTKLSGDSPCQIGAVGKCRFHITDDKFYITTVEDQCAARSKAPDGKPYTRIQ
jgi:hypothetical protein